MTWPIGNDLGDGRRFAPAAERNKDPILGVLKRMLPETGLVLEIGSGTGQHVVHFAAALPRLSWQPSDSDADLRHSAATWIRRERLRNVRAPIALELGKRPWPIRAADAIVCINVVHVSPWTATLALLEGASEILSRGGVLYLYGPYRRRGGHTAPSNERFDAELRAHDPRWGLRDIEAIADAAQRAGFDSGELVAMPANNFSLVFRKRDPATPHTRDETPT